ncbi:hypothetical protein C7445_104242 [Alicyclobacillus sacchari]|uniref:Uncharacterized protein n=1 Tax=Alicyclobacillus sacchari TaxID=392010 RepID=A0A4R8LQA5_9BACL|nr:hypothetical protein [Alicyclobacillus sacchari]TDY49729.1 hypothetical protein C7445_104242 [Alicyclobacillus sacchari]
MRAKLGWASACVAVSLAVLTGCGTPANTANQAANTAAGFVAGTGNAVGRGLADVGNAAGRGAAAIGNAAGRGVADVGNAIGGALDPRMAPGARSASPDAGVVARVPYGTIRHQVQVDAASKTVNVLLNAAAPAQVNATRSNLTASDGRAVTAPTSERAFTDGRGVTAPTSPNAFTDGRGVTAPGAYTGGAAPASGGWLQVSIPTGWNVVITGNQANHVQFRSAADLNRVAVNPQPGQTTTQVRYHLAAPGQFHLVTTDANGRVAQVLDTVIVSKTIQHPVFMVR